MSKRKKKIRARVSAHKHKAKVIIYGKRSKRRKRGKRRGAAGSGIMGGRFSSAPGKLWKPTGVYKVSKAVKEPGIMGGKRKRVRVRRHKRAARVVLFGNPCAQTTTNLSGGAIMPRKSKRSMPWFVKRGKRRRKSYLGGRNGSGGKISDVMKNGALTVAGSALGSLVAARAPLPANLANFRGLLPIAAGIGLGMSRWGKRGMGLYIALGMVVSGGLALGRQYAPQFFAGEDDMLGLPELDEPLGIAYQSGEDGQFGDDDDDEGMAGGDALGVVYQGGESPEDVELYGDFATGADV